MAIKLKAQEKGVALKTKSKKGKKQNRRLVDIIDDVCDEEYLSNLKIYLHKARGLRNHFAHPEKHHFSGSLGTSTYIMHVVNVLNRLFKNDEWHIEYAKKSHIIRNQLQILADKVSKVEADRPAYLISRIHRFELVDDHLILSVTPVLDKYEVSDKGFTSEPVEIFPLRNFQINEKVISGILDNGEKIKISVTNHPDDQRARNEVNNYLSKLSTEQLSLYSDTLEFEATQKITTAEYLYYKRKHNSHFFLK